MIETLREEKQTIVASGRSADSADDDEKESVRYLFKIAQRVVRKAGEQAQL